MKVLIAFFVGLFVSSASFACEVPSTQFIVKSFHKQGFTHYTADTNIAEDFNAVNQAYAMATWELDARLPNVSADEVYTAMPASCAALSGGAIPQTVYKSSARCFGAAFVKLAKKYGCSIR